MRGRVLAQRGDTQRALADFELANDLAVGEGRYVLTFTSFHSTPECIQFAIPPTYVWDAAQAIASEGRPYSFMNHAELRSLKSCSGFKAFCSSAGGRRASKAAPRQQPHPRAPLVRTNCRHPGAHS